MVQKSSVLLATTVLWDPMLAFLVKLARTQMSWVDRLAVHARSGTTVCKVRSFPSNALLAMHVDLAAPLVQPHPALLVDLVTTRCWPLWMNVLHVSLGGTVAALVWLSRQPPAVLGTSVVTMPRHPHLLMV